MGAELVVVLPSSELNVVLRLASLVANELEQVEVCKEELRAQA